MRISTVTPILLLLLTHGRVGPVSSFAPLQAVSRAGGEHHPPRNLLNAKTAGGEGDESGGGYKFGDLSRGLAKKFVSSVEKTTGKPYEFGDITRKLDEKAKAKVNELTGNEEYQFGDLSRAVDASIKQRVNDMTGKESYTPGDLSKEIIKRAISGEYKLEDIIFLVKIFIALGANFSPVAGALPAKVLIDLLDYNLAAQLGSKVAGILATELDRRMKEAVTGNPDYKLGAHTKGELMNWMGKGGENDSYQFGDITKALAKQYSENTNEQDKKTLKAARIDLTNERVLAELKEWDKSLAKDGLPDGKGK